MSVSENWSTLSVDRNKLAARYFNVYKFTLCNEANRLKSLWTDNIRSKVSTFLLRSYGPIVSRENKYENNSST